MGKLKNFSIPIGFSKKFSGNRPPTALSRTAYGNITITNKCIDD